MLIFFDSYHYFIRIFSTVVGCYSLVYSLFDFPLSSLRHSFTGKRSGTQRRRGSRKVRHQRRQDCWAVHESCASDQTISAPPPRLGSERSTCVNNNFLFVLFSARNPPRTPLFGYVVPLLSTSPFPPHHSFVRPSDRTARALDPPGLSPSDHLHLRPTISRRFGDARFRHIVDIAVIATTSP